MAHGQRTWVRKTFNISSRSKRRDSRLLSNFANTPFRISGYHGVIASVEGFIQGIKFPYHDQMRERAFASSGSEAKKYGAIAKKKYGNKSVWWNLQEIEYGSKKHHQIIYDAIRAKLRDNRECVDALLRTGTLRLTHITGEPESSHTSFPARLFCDCLMIYRKSVQSRIKAFGS